MNNIHILYISISGNTRNFIQKLTNYAVDQHQRDPKAPLITSTEISDLTDFKDETTDFFVMVPTYLDGGNGIDNGVKELMTNTLGEYLMYHNNHQHVLGLIGSGNRNFNEQYILTAKRYAKMTNSSVIDDYELRGTPTDVMRIYKNLARINHNLQVTGR
ncbi:protein involved in ribonucleotide reduction [Weissella beninensis]|uniref:Class Ib ribonucleoside-diphosphate reductase assembly flavoprotein NrdI n=1 Tax=Periweissella beninensis TaxID=504936 RepID=A0ABT0VJA6_9LACO|nr:class Ib ribonucleoside-diphosphate reductase assembly flavoprotein NrdI [Periweissella beninensis]MBM7543323.1 protein involved in ribonucleotide reduction [Periweissella beninensis]MCM2437916.1 class Ib ribonucleoside-diphosphate reductase assembly flavoprotein NrdI [Periweissella beninensis]